MCRIGEPEADSTLPSPNPARRMTTSSSCIPVTPLRNFSGRTSRACTMTGAGCATAMAAVLQTAIPEIWDTCKV